MLLIDADQYLFKATAAVEKETRWDEFNHVLYSNREEAWENFARMIRQLFERFGTEEHAMCFSGSPPCFRRKIADTYKAMRSPRKPLCYAALRELCEAHYNVIAFPGLEADDVMGILATKPGKHKRIIISQDKDMKTIPGFVMREGGVMHITEEQADYWHMYQTLVGDTSDGFKGCPGIGPKKAEVLLKDAKDRWGVVKSTYVKQGSTEDDALQQARLARILRWSDWDTEAKEPILWTP
jgi:DNA polymerase-1